MNAKESPHIVRRALESVRGLVSGYVISTEPGDMLAVYLLDLFREWGVNGHVFQFARVNGAQMRTHLFAEAAGYAREWCCDYLLNLDADDEIRADPGFVWFPPDNGSAECIDLLTEDQGSVYPFPRLFRVGLPWIWQGVLHETPIVDQGRCKHPDPLHGLTYVKHMSPRPISHYAEHARQLAGDLARDPNQPREVFYLAQSYKDAGQPEMAIYFYRQRLTMQGSAAERFTSQLRIGQLLGFLGQIDQAIEALTAAHEMQPQRAEPVYHLAACHRVAGRWSTALLYARLACHLPLPHGQSGMVARDVYDWRAPLEMAVASLATGDTKSARLWAGIASGGGAPDVYLGDLLDQARKHSRG